VLGGLVTHVIAQEGKDCLAWSEAALAERALAKRAAARVKRMLAVDTVVKTEGHEGCGEGRRACNERAKERS